MQPPKRGAASSTLARVGCGALTLALTAMACTELAAPATRREGAAASAGAPDGVSPPDRNGSGGSTEQPGGSDEPEPGSAGAEAGHAPVAGTPEPTGPEPTDPEPEAPEVVGPDVDEPSPEEPDVEEPPLEGDGGDGPGLPCDVQRLLRARCQSCHADPPIEGAAISLLSFEDLSARSKNDPSVTVAARCLKRMKDSLRPMPPAPANAVTISDMTPLQAWLDQGMPPAECEETPTDDPYAASPVCTSGGYWTAIDSGSPWMNPGLSCIKCHRQSPNFSPQFSVAGTVFATAHEPDKCFGVPLATGARVVITDANGQELSPIPVVSGGNFGAILSGLSLPYRAKVVVGERERAMLTPQTNGDCNACHTQTGAQGARGRVIVP